ncbi:hypothetical protein GJ688_17735 [Heliobacillus mobilis]|uniref:Uncharacterized protein n=1 Tax=Heliobacterium mobile TaxID=28064 RepID=A0A6I3SPX4_HELMO|nr:hypothetical protein [Heliobacterium mobile]MTV50776.1 hypothetical protein [Heliobacterium mobile]
MISLADSFFRFLSLNLGWETAVQIKGIMSVGTGFLIGLAFATVYYAWIFLRIKRSVEFKEQTVKLHENLSFLAIPGEHGKEALIDPKTVSEVIEVIALYHRYLLKPDKTMAPKSVHRTKRVVNYIVTTFVILILLGLYFAFSVVEPQ